MRRIGKGFLGVETPLFDAMLVTQQVQDDVAEVEEAEDNKVSVAPTLPSPTPATTPPPPQQEPKVANLEQDKIAQALEITKLKQRVKKLEKKRGFKSSGFKRLRKVGTTQRVESSNDIVVDDQKDVSKWGGGIAKLDADKNVTLVDVDANTQGRMEKDVTAVKDINAAESEPTVFDDEEMVKRLQNEEIEQAATRERQEKEDLERAKVLQQQYDQNQEDIDWNIVKVSSSHSTQEETPTVDPTEISKEDVQNMLQIVSMAEFKVEALQVKYPLIDWEIYSKGSRTYWRMIRVGGITQAFQSFEDMLKDFDREDLDALWRITKEKFSTAMPTRDKEKALWVELTRLYEPNADDVF
nr:hypothetical protein [Tanacetum cinerariifolium]